MWITDYLKEYNIAEPYKEYLSVMEVTNGVMETDVNQFLITIMNSMLIESYNMILGQ